VSDLDIGFLLGLVVQAVIAAFFFGVQSNRLNEVSKKVDRIESHGTEALQVVKDRQDRGLVTLDRLEERVEELERKCK
jgi:uncharacterized membrane protein YciS (DUF1049 family)